MKKLLITLMSLTIIFLIYLTSAENVQAAHISPCQGGGGVTNKYVSTGSTSTHRVDTYCNSCGGIINSSTESHKWGSWYYENETIHKRKCTQCGGSVSRVHSDDNGNGKCDGCNYVMDATAPTGSITSSTTVYTNSYSVTITVTGTDESGGSGMQKASFPTWSDANGQDDIVWYDVAGAGPNYSITIYLTNHTPGTQGVYYVDPYIYDNAGNSRCLGRVVIYYDTTAPTGSATIPSYTTTGSVTVTAEATDTGGSGMASVKFPTWSVVNGQDDIVWYQTISSSSSYSYTVDLTKHSPGTEGKYNIHVYAYDKAGNSKYINGKEVIYDKTAPTIGSHDSTKYTNNVTGTVRVNLYNVADNLSGVSKVDWYIYKDGTLLGVEQGGVSGTTYYKDVALSGEGTYIIHGIVYDNAGNSYNWYVDHGMTIIADGTAPNHGNWVNSSGTVITGATNYTNAASGSTYRVYAMGASDSFSGVDAMYVWMSTDGGANWNLLAQQRMIETTINGTRAWYYDVPITVEGSYLIHTCPVDRAGNWTWGGPNQTLVVDRTAPNHGNWVNSSGTVITGATNYTNAASGSTYRVYAMNASDALSGVDAMYVWMSTDGGANWNLLSQQRMNETTIGGTRAWYYDVPITVEGSYLIHTCPVDRAGNWVWGGPNQALIVDRTAPYVSHITYDPGWKNTSVTKDVRFGDALSGVKLIEYSYDLNTWYSDWDSGSGGDVRKTWSGERNQVLYFRATDNAGNTYVFANDGVNPSAYDLKIDTTAPTIGSHDSTKYTNNVTGTIRVNLYNVADNLSGVKEVLWWLYKDGTLLWSNQAGANSGTTYYKDITLSGEGTYRIHGVAYDNAGNAYDWHTEHGMVIIADSTPPEVVSITYYGDDVWHNSTLYKEVIFRDEISGMSKIEYSYDQTTWYTDWDSNTFSSDGKQLSSKKTWSGEQDRELWFRATDNAGNVYKYPGPYDLQIDSTPPTVLVSSVTYPSDVNISLSDELSYVTHWGVTSSTTAPSTTASSNTTTGTALNIWYPIAQTDGTTAVKYTGLAVGSYYAWGKDAAGNTKYTQFKVSKATITAPSSPAAKTYNGSSQNSGITVPANTSIVTASSTTSATNAGTYNVVLKLNDATNYTWSDGTTANKTVTWTINKKAVTVTAVAQTITYGGNIATGTSYATLASQVSGHTLSAVTLKASTTTVTTTGTITPSAATIKSGSTDVTANYSITYNTGKLTINAAKITAPSSPSAKTYNGSSQNSGITAPANTSIVTASSTTSATNAGTYNVVLKLNDTTNYTWSDGTTANKTVTWTINKKAVTVTAAAQTITYGGSIATGTSYATLASQVSGHTLSAVTLKASTTTVTTTGTITPSAATIKNGSTDVTANYSITYNTGKLTINAAKITAPSSPSAKTYNGASQNSGITAPSNTSIVTASSTTSATNAGTYNVVLKLNDTTNYTWSDGTTANKTVTWKINKATVGAPTNVAVSTAGVVTWTAGSNATSHQISIDGTNWTTATTGVDYNSTITAATGNRTIYVRALNSDTTNYTTPSSNGSKTVTVYKLTINKGTGISSVSGAGNYISGRSVSINATASTGYTWSKWTVESGSTPASTTTAKTTVTVSAATTLTATTTTNALTFSAQTLTAGSYNAAYSKAFTGASAGTGTYTYKINSVTCDGTAVTASSSKYNGLSLSGTTISGTPTKAGTYVFSIKATDSGSGATKDANITIVINKIAGKVELDATSGTLTYPTIGSFNVKTNTSGGGLSVSTSDSAVATASISGTKVTVTPGTTAGEATITVTSAATTNYNAASATYTVTVNNGSLTVSASGYSGTYDGAAHGISVSVTNVTEASITYCATQNGTYSSTNPTYTNAGTYTTWYKVTKAGYTTVTGSKTIAISKATITAPSSPSAKTYNGTSQNSGITAPTNTSVVTGSSTTSATNAGTYNVVLKLNDTTNYTWSDGTTENKTVTWKINKYNLSNATIAGVSAQTYTGSAIKPTPAVTVPIPSGKTTTVTTTDIEYSYTNNTNVGTATIKITAKSTSTNYTGNKSTTFEISTRSISGGTVTLTPTTYVFDGTAKEPAVTLQVNGKTLTKGTEYGVVYTNNTNVGTATVTITGKGNYSGTVTKTFTITNASLNVSASGYTGTYDGAAHGITVNVTGVTGASITYSTTQNGTYSTTKPTYTDAGTYTVYYKVTKTNYSTVSGSKTVTINRKEITVEWSNKQLVYNGKEQLPTAKAESGVAGETINLIVERAQINVGQYVAVAKIQSVTGGREKASNYRIVE